ncbi:sodium:proton antiporter [Barnesiella viscericola DSM 18177]|uniref:Sodium:proton antiporter n=1 Tax=Barnesiella viscericola DSM 18177 TaxID=880074 RepID=W0EMA9_9BACT|nr:Na+/H+ antiporter NhaC family protein [Barnesiella viscericola]AHF11927.1 sodium:proton antiporter [Barnesiella viscericola DSM 18177]
MNEKTKIPAPFIAIIPLIVLVALLALVIPTFGSDALLGGSQVSLLVATAVCVAIAMGRYNYKWSVLEEGMAKNIKKVTPAIIILLLIGAISGTWMLSGVVPTLISYGLQILTPRFFLASCCIICAIVSVITGSSWTTIATIGVALLGIGKALGFAEGWIAGAIISGAYFGDKISPLSDTTVLASSTTGTKLFTHIRYMLITTVPSMVITLIIFAVAGFSMSHTDSAQSALFAETLAQKFNLSPWLLVVPFITGVLILAKLPTIITLFISTVIAAICILIFQPHILLQIVPGDTLDFTTGFKALMTSVFGSTTLSTGQPEIDALVATRGMRGMMDTIWLIICAMCFGGVMSASQMIRSITDLFVRFVHKPKSAVCSTVASGFFFNACTADQYLSIILTGNLFKELYHNRGLESRLLSRTVEDSVTVTSVLIPWNSCGMTQATVLGVGTLTYLPYCFFNLLSPLMSILVVFTGFKIKQGLSTPISHPENPGAEAATHAA